MSKQTAATSTIQITSPAQTLMLAFELGEGSWLLGFSARFGEVGDRFHRTPFGDHHERHFTDIPVGGCTRSCHPLLHRLEAHCQATEICRSEVPSALKLWKWGSQCVQRSACQTFRGSSWRAASVQRSILGVPQLVIDWLRYCGE